MPSYVHAFIVPMQQNGSVSVTQNSVVVDQDSTNELNAYQLEVAGHAFNEAWLHLDYLPGEFSNDVIVGSIWVSVIDDGTNPISHSAFNLEFLLEVSADYSILFQKSGEADANLLLENDTGIVVSLDENQENLLSGNLDPGNYSLSIESTAFIHEEVIFQNYSQIVFFLQFFPIPEPNGIVLLASSLMVLLGGERRWRRAYCKGKVYS